MAASDTLTALRRELKLTSDHLVSGKALSVVVTPLLTQLATEIDTLENPPGP